MTPTKKDYEQVRDSLQKRTGWHGHVTNPEKRAIYAALDQAIAAKEPVDREPSTTEMMMAYIDGIYQDVPVTNYESSEAELRGMEWVKRLFARTAPTPAERNSDTDPNLIWHGSKTYNPKHHEVAPAGSTRILAALRAMLGPLLEAAKRANAEPFIDYYNKGIHDRDLQFYRIVANTLSDPEFINLVQGETP